MRSRSSRFSRSSRATRRRSATTSAANLRKALPSCPLVICLIPAPSVLSARASGQGRLHPLHREVLPPYRDPDRSAPSRRPSGHWRTPSTPGCAHRCGPVRCVRDCAAMPTTPAPPMPRARTTRAGERRQRAWKAWGPYLSERQWGTVREDYSADGRPGATSPTTRPARARTAGAKTGSPVSLTSASELCLALALWNGNDPILKERMFGLSNGEGNHGEDVKEYWFYLDSTPTHSYMRCQYKYPQRPFPYLDLRLHERPARQVRHGIRAARHRHLRRGPLLRRRRGVRQGSAGRHPDGGHAPTTVDPTRRRCTSCRRFGFVTPGPGVTTSRGPSSTG